VVRWPVLQVPGVPVIAGLRFALVGGDVREYVTEDIVATAMGPWLRFGAAFSWLGHRFSIPDRGTEQARGSSPNGRHDHLRDCGPCAAVGR
jgi:hypothetical protein